MSETPLDGAVGQLVIEVVSRRASHIAGTSEVSLDLGEGFGAEDIIRDQVVAQEANESLVTIVPVDVAVADRLITQLLDGAQQFTLNGVGLAFRRHIVGPDLPGLLEMSHALPDTSVKNRATS